MSSYLKSPNHRAISKLAGQFAKLSNPDPRQQARFKRIAIKCMINQIVQDRKSMPAFLQVWRRLLDDIITKAREKQSSPAETPAVAQGAR
jgi:hypothetical protein